MVADIEPQATAGDDTAATLNLVGFRLSQRHYACHLVHVESALRMVAITPVPDAPSIVIGVVDYRGEILPVVDVRPSLVGLERRPTLDDRLLVLRIHGRRVALIADEVTDVIEVNAANLMTPPPPLDQSPLLDGVIRTDSGLVFVLHVDVLVPADIGDALTNAQQLRALIEAYLQDSRKAMQDVALR